MGAIRPQDLKSIDAFRADGRYGGDGTRIDLAYAVYALSHGVSTAKLIARSGRAICRIKGTNGGRMITWNGPSRKHWQRSSVGVSAPESDVGTGFTSRRCMCGTITRCVGRGWSKASCTKQYRKKSMISTHPARKRRKFFRPSKSNSKTKIHIPNL